DVGFIPYRPEPRIVRNGFPLKALEMSATALPLVTTEMYELRDLAAGIRVTASSNEFEAALGVLGRSSVTPATALALRELAERNDSDAKFDAVRARVEPLVADRPATRLDVFTAASPTDWQLTASLARTPRFRRIGAAAAARSRSQVIELAGKCPRVVRNVV